MACRSAKSSQLVSVLLLACLLSHVHAQQQSGPQGAGQAPGLRPEADDEYLVGFGISDITGPSADINLVSSLSAIFELVRERLASGPPNSSSSSNNNSPLAPVPQQLDWRRLSPPGIIQSQVMGQGGPAARTRGESLASGKPRREPNQKQQHSDEQQERARPNLLADRTGPGASAPLAAAKSRPRSARRESRQATISLNDKPLVSLSYPNWRDFANPKLQFKVNLNNFLTNSLPTSPRQSSTPLTVDLSDFQGTKLVYISLDNGMVSQLLRTRVLLRLKEMFGGVFNESNVMISATHTHSTPGGHFQYMLYNIPSAGYIAQTLEALVDGIGRCVMRGYNHLQPARLRYLKGQLLGASINRSPTSYLNNPEEERRLHEHDTDKEMFMIRADTLKGEPLGMLNWFAVHGTSMNNTNHLISSDNKGYAALLFEQELNGPASLPGRGQFVAVFAQANEGDVSPNTRGPRCIDTGLPCDLASSTCGNPPRNEKCIASGPGRDMFESTKIIAYKQYYKARELFLDTARQRPIRGPLRFVHEYIDITRQRVPQYESALGLARRRAESVPQQEQSASRRRSLAGRSGGVQESQPTAEGAQQNATCHETCVASLGYSFAAGTTDGPGAFDFQQGDTESSRYWNLVRNFLRKPSPELIKCQHPKPILLATGEMDFPYMWHPKIVPTQLFMIGREVALVGLPGEFTTMSGRRVRQAVRAALSPLIATATSSNQSADLIGEESHTARPARGNATSYNQAGAEQQVEVVLSGLSNIYTSYVTTVEEYEVQRYEGASTLYGPHTLQAYVNQFVRLARVLATSASASQSYELTQAGLQPPDLSKSLFTLKPGVVFDGAPHGKSFGDLLADVDKERIYGSRELVGAVFVAGNPRNDLKQEDSFLFVEHFDAAQGSWSTVATDANWETKFIWERTNTLFGESKATCQWEIPDHCQSGVYRIRHQGAHKTLLQTINQYEGRSAPFKVLCQGDGHAHPAGQNATVALLDETQRLAEQAEAQEAAVRESASKRPTARAKSDQRQGTSVLSGLRNRLSLLFG